METKWKLLRSPCRLRTARWQLAMNVMNAAATTTWSFNSILPMVIRESSAILDVVHVSLAGDDHVNKHANNDYQVE